MDELEWKSQSTPAALDSVYRELTILHKANVAKEHEVQDAALMREILGQWPTFTGVGQASVSGCS